MTSRLKSYKSLAISILNGSLVSEMSSPRLVVVFGATGRQGGSVVSSLLAVNKNSNTGKLYTIRAVTRNPSSEKGKALTAQGVEVVAGDMDDYNSVLKAFEV